MHAFWKHVLTAGFICGVISLAIRFLDDQLPGEKKERFNSWFKQRSPIWRRVSILRCYEWIEHHMWAYALTAGLLTILVIRLTGFAKDWRWLAFAFFVFAVWALICTGGNAIQLYLRKGVRAFGIPLFAAAVIGALALAISPHGRTTLKFLLEFLVLLPLASVACVNFVMWPVIVAAWPFAVLLLMLSRSVWWISTYPKGPWAGLVFVLTMVTGIVRLFLF